MLGNRKFIVDVFGEVKVFTRAWQDDSFFDFAKHEIVPGAIYLISRQQFSANIERIRQLATDEIILPILGNPAEGSETMLRQIQALGILDLVRQNRVLVVTGGYLQHDIPCLYYENFLPKILDYQENLDAIDTYWQQWNDSRPYKFLCLNGRGRWHRRQILTNLADVLHQAIWTNLDSMSGPIQLLDPKYEFEFYKHNTQLDQTGYVKYSLFDNQWGEIYLNPQAYLDSYFSLVTETVFEYPHTFRTEKLWKPIAIGHPFVIVANYGYYRDLRALGFRTFDRFIDESFDLVENNQDRLAKIMTLVRHLCREDLGAFVRQTQEICKYNQQLLAELSPKIRSQFPQQFEKFINERS